MMSEEMKLLNYFDTIFGTNTIEDFQLFSFGYLLAKELDIESKIKKE